MSIRAVLLDLGNVLVWHDNGLLFQRLADRAGLQARDVARAVSGPGWLAANRGELDAEGIRRMVCGELGVDIPLGEFAALWSSHFTVHHQVLPIVEGLMGRVKLLLLSNTNELHAQYVKATLPLLARFDHLLLSNELGMVKPEPEIYREALRRAGTEPGETAFFDDMPEFVEAARHLGIQGFVFSEATAFRAQLATIGL